VPRDCGNWPSGVGEGWRRLVEELDALEVGLADFDKMGRE